MEISHWPALFGVCLLGAMSPGPSLAVIVANTLRSGRAGGVRAGLAHGCALFVVAGAMLLRALG